MIDALSTLSSAGSAPSLAERLVLRQLGRVRAGVLDLVHGGSSLRFGSPAADGLRATVRVRDARAFRRILWGGSLGAAEAYLDGAWEADDLTALVRLLLRNAEALSGIEGGVSRLGGWLASLTPATRRNSVAGSRRNIAAHYDLGNDFFRLMLDPTLTYSSAIFPSAGASLEAASLHKLDLLCRRLDLRPGDHLLEIGTGWGSLALHAAQRFGCRVTTTTVSREQFSLATERVRAAGLADRVRVLNEDYRALTGRYDKLVSCEMIEAVGWQYYPTFFRRCARLLRPGGRMALQAITLRDQAFDAHRREVDFIKRYVFPGSCIPSVTALLQAATRASDLVLRELADYTPHYARTLAAWREKLLPQKAEVVAKFDERFWRIWMYYLAYCEAGFQERYLGLAHFVFERPEELS